MSFNKTIRIGAVKAEPFVYSSFVEFKKGCTECGVELEFIYNVIYNFLHLNVSGVLYNNDSDFEAAIQNGEIDIIGNTKRKDYALIYKNWYTTPSTVYSIGFFVKSPREIKVVNLIFSFSWDLWLCLILVTAFLHLGFHLVSTRFHFTFLTSHFAYIFWLIVTTCIMELYSNMITADLLTKSEGVPLFNDLADLGGKLLNKECRFVINNQYMIYNSTIKKTVLNPEHDQYWADTFRSAFKVNPPLIVENTVDLYGLVRNSSCLVGLDYVGYDNSLYNSMCGMQVKMFPKEIIFRTYVYYHKMESLQNIIDNIFASEAVHQLPNFLLHKYSKRYFESSNFACLETVNRPEFSFSLHRLYYCFSVFITGIIVSGLILIIQRMKLYLWRNIQKKQEYNFVTYG